MGKIEITLVSDLCVSSGEVYNNSIDTEICYDSYGLPYIPAKRIKGCLRECAGELADWHYMERENISGIFGEKGTVPAGLHLSNAYLKDHELYVKDILGLKGNRLVHPQNVLQNFSYTRTQTRIDGEKGIAVAGTLRTARILKKGLVFIAEVGIQDAYEKDLCRCCKALRYMGVSRTRGLGEVKVSYHKDGQIGDGYLIEKDSWQRKSTFVEGKTYRIDYAITLHAPAVLKSIVGGQGRTQNYIEGGKILGILAQRLKTKGAGQAFADFIRPEDPVICSNAYVSKDHERYVPIAASIYKEKADMELEECVGDKHITKLKILDRAAEGNESGTRKSKVTGYFINGDQTLEVQTEVRYHHERSGDKTIGRAGKDSAFYQLESISKGQQFQGYIMAEGAWAGQILGLLEERENLRIGYARSSEYGKASIKVINVRAVELMEAEETNEFVVKLNSPAIFYNDFGMYTTDMTALKKEMESLIEARTGMQVALRIKRQFLKHTKTGGYNATWNMHKPTLEAVDMGSVCVFATGQSIDIGKLQDGFIGERTMEGYGEIEVYRVPEQQAGCLVLKESGKPPGRKETLPQSSGLLPMLALNEIKRKIERQGIQKSKEVIPDFSERKITPAVISWLLMAIREQETYEGFKKVVGERSKNEKKNEKRNEKAKIAEAFCTYEEEAYKESVYWGYIGEEMQKQLFPEQELITTQNNTAVPKGFYRIYMNAFLLNARYELRRQKEKQKAAQTKKGENHG